MVTDNEIIAQLKQKETYLIHQLEKVRIAISAFSADTTNHSPQKAVQGPDPVSDSNQPYDQYLSLDQKVIYALRKINHGYIDDIVSCLIASGDTTDKERLFKSLTGSASKLLGKNLLTADKRGKKYRYHLNKDTEKERAEILPLS